MGDELVRTALQFLKTAEDRSIPLRLAGSVAVLIHCKHGDALESMGREMPNDLDFVSEPRAADALRSLFADFGYAMDKEVDQASDREQWLFRHLETGITVDIFFGRLNYCHEIPLSGRLHRDPQTIPLAELLLSKLQIVELTEKDVKDATALLLSHQLGPDDNEIVNVDRIAQLLSRNWGLYYTSKLNLEKIRAHASDLSLGESDVQRLFACLDDLDARIEREPKSRAWRIRARIGPRIRWYQAIDEK